MRHTAYLVVICDLETNAIKMVDIWSQPEWLQSMCAEDPSYVAYQVSVFSEEPKKSSYEMAKRQLLQTISMPLHRYYRLWKLYDDRIREELRRAGIPAVVNEG